jgi:hypothetical protein
VAAHDAGREDDRPNDRPPPYWAEATRELIKRLDNDLRKRSRGGVLPWERNVEVGQVDWWRVHAWALDWIDELLEIVLPDGELIDGGTVWRGRHDPQSPWFIVTLLSGAWSEPASGRRDDDLIGLVARVYRLPMRRAAIKLAQLLGIEAVRRG